MLYTSPTVKEARERLTKSLQRLNLVPYTNSSFIWAIEDDLAKISEYEKQCYRDCPLNSFDDEKLTLFTARQLELSEVSLGLLTLLEPYSFL